MENERAPIVEALEKLEIKKSLSKAVFAKQS